MALAPLTFTLDVEDHRPHDGWPERFTTMTRKVLDFVGERGVRGTFFVVGELAETHPEMVRDIAAEGHEVAMHAYKHVALTHLDPVTFREESKRGRAVLEEASGASVVGFRAPTASLTPKTAWAIDILSELGFQYSSSVIPAYNPLFGWPGAPRNVFRWPSGLVEFPAPIAGAGPIFLPLLGGTYFRVVPWQVTRFARRMERTAVTGTYCHPYDFDTDEPRWQVGDVHRFLVPLLWYNRGRMFDKLGKLLASGPIGPPFVEYLDTLGELQTFEPAVLRPVTSG